MIRFPDTTRHPSPAARRCGGTTRLRRAALLALVLLASPLAAQELSDAFSARAVLSFAESLYGEGDYARAAGEFQRFLFIDEGDERDREAAFMIAKCRQRAGAYGEAGECFRQIITTGTDDEWAQRAVYELAITNALSGDTAAALALLRDPGPLSDVYDPSLLRGWGLLLGDDWEGADRALAGSASALAPDLLLLARKGQALPHRSPALAGLLSAVIPGVGKLYADRPADALFSFGLIGSLALLSGLGFADEGISSVKGWTYGSLALVFHAGSVYGSVVAAEQYNRAGAQGIETQARGFYEANLR